MSGPGTCKRCDQPIIWAVTRYGYKRPYNVEPAEEGMTLVKYNNNGTMSYSARHLRRDDPPGTTLHRMHFDTCVKIHGSKDSSKKE